jgi:2-polyprenyl-3-methyl-5-hydroxy-6-metoxy-1,4-benzoquinol methylase
VASEIYQRLIQDAMEYTGRSTTDELWKDMNGFLQLRRTTDLSDAEWYRQFPHERIGRQVEFNTQSEHKKRFTEYILSAIQHNKPLKILDFGCGIGVTALTLAEKGHQVTAMDIGGTGTFEFLKWRAAKHKVPMTFIDSNGGPPQLTGEYDIIIAMDSLEHIADWKKAIAELSNHLRDSGVLFSNNAILDDMMHPEHYELRPKAFLAACNEFDLRPLTQLSYVKQTESVYA